jgi:hypothetical protein
MYILTVLYSNYFKRVYCNKFSNLNEFCAKDGKWRIVSPDEGTLS